MGGVRRTDWFRFHPADFLMSEAVVCMDDWEVGIYIKMLSQAWQAGGSLPADPSLIARLIRSDAGKVQEALQGVVGTCWASGDDGRLRNPRLSEEWAYANGRAQAAKVNGSKGGRSKAANSQAGEEPTANQQLEQLAPDSSTTDLATESKKKSKNLEVEEEGEREGESERGARAPASDEAPPGGKAARPKVKQQDFDASEFCPAEVWADYCERVPIPPRTAGGWTQQAKALGRLHEQGDEAALEDWFQWAESCSKPTPISERSVDVTLDKRRRASVHQYPGPNRGQSIIDLYQSGKYEVIS